MLDDESTIALRVPQRRRPVLGGAALLLALVVLAAVVMIRRPATAPHFDPGRADETTILAEQPAMLTATRWSAEPAVLILDFPDLEQQGRMLDRVAALVEKAGAPRDRVLSPAQLADLLARTNDTVATFYYGHDYRAADLARFFSLAARDHVALGAEEQRLHDMVAALGWLQPGAAGALVSIVATGGAVGARMRRTILHHELSHGVYFTHPGYVAATRALWRQQMTAEERDRFRAWLGNEGYDPSNEDLMMNECQAYLVFTPDPGFFTPGLVGMSDARAAALSDTFLAGRPVDARQEQP